jgi:hypothetical protein
MPVPIVMANHLYKKSDQMCVYYHIEEAYEGVKFRTVLRNFDFQPFGGPFESAPPVCWVTGSVISLGNIGK